MELILLVDTNFIAFYLQYSSTQILNGVANWHLFFSSGQSYKGFMIINYDFRVVPDLKIAHITTNVTFVKGQILLQKTRFMRWKVHRDETSQKLI